MSQANRRHENEYTAVFQAFLEDHHREDIARVPPNGISRITKNFRILLPSPWSRATRQRNFETSSTGDENDNFPPQQSREQRVAGRPGTESKRDGSPQTATEV